MIEHLKVDGVDRVNWFSTYRVHHRVADQFRQGRAFLLGDAAHIHSPVGGQGMNTGIGDAVNLAWKLAAVLQGRAPTGCSTRYEPERIAFARRLVATTDRVFTAVTSAGRSPRFVRVGVVPRLVRWCAVERVRRFMFRTVSQTAMHIGAGALSEGARDGSAAATGCPGSRPTISARWRAALAGARLWRAGARNRGNMQRRAAWRCTGFPWNRGSPGGPRARLGLCPTTRWLCRPRRSGAQAGEAGAYLDSRRIRSLHP